MSQAAIDYLSANKDKYSREVLAESLRKAGYEPGDINESLRVVYSVPEFTKVADQEKITGAQSFWDFKGVYVYKSKAEKVVDYIIGVIFPWVFTMLIGLISYTFYWVCLLVHVIAIFYFRKRRRFLFHGLLLYVYFFLISIVLGFVIFGLGLGNFLF